MEFAIGDGIHYKKGSAMLKRNLLVASLFAVATFVGLGLSAFATDDPKAVAAAVASTEALDAALTDKVTNRIAVARAFAEASPFPSATELASGVYA